MKNLEDDGDDPFATAWSRAHHDEKMSKLPPFPYKDDTFPDEKTRNEFFARRERMIRTKRGEILKTYIPSQAKATWKSVKGSCSKCGKKKPLTNDYLGNRVCADCLFRSL